MQEELLAQLIEEVSLFTRKEPVRVTRPGQTNHTPQATPEGLTERPDGGFVATGLQGMLQMAAAGPGAAAPGGDQP